MSTFPNNDDAGFKSGELFVKIFFGLVGGVFVISLIINTIRALMMRAKKQKIVSHHDEGAEKAAALGRMIRELVAVDMKEKGEEMFTRNYTSGVKVEKATVERFIKDFAREKPIRFSSEQIEEFTWNYSSKLGSGGFGVVYKGEFPYGVQIAVKLLNKNSIDKRGEEQFMAEVSTIGRTYHKNIVRLYGFCFDAETKALVYEYMENGSLDNVLFGKKHVIEWEELYEIAIGAAKGLEYLHHECNQRIIHYDIKPGNVLLDSNLCPKIADFGLAKLCNRDSTHVTMSGCRGTPGYAAPELWMPLPITYKCDVYSFGMMLFEIMGRRRNLDISLGESQEWFPRRVWEKLDKGELELIMEESGIEEKDRVKAKTMSMVALWCVQYLPETRPSMFDVLKILEGGAEVTMPPNPFQHLVLSCSKLPLCMGSSINTSNTDDGKIDNGRKYSTPIMKKYEIEVASSSG